MLYIDETRQAEIGRLLRIVYSCFKAPLWDPELVRLLVKLGEKEQGQTGSFELDLETLH